MRGSAGIGAGVFARQGQLFAGGPAEGWLQRTSSAARLVALVAATAAAAFVSDPIVLAGIGSAALVLAVFSFLDLISILKLSAVPVVLLAVPSWLAGVLFFNVPWNAMGVGILRVWCSVLVAMVLLHSIGLIHIAAALRGLGVPAELCMTWRLMIAQADSFSLLSAEMELARRARLIKDVRGGIVRRMVGGQMGILLARTWQRSRELGMAMDARENRISDSKNYAAHSRMGRSARLERLKSGIRMPGQTEIHGGQERGDLGDASTLDVLSGSVVGSRRAGVPILRGGRAGVPILREADALLFRIVGLSHEFLQGDAALDDISAEIFAGGCVAILGCNGAGKSTLLHLLAGLLTPTRGEVLWCSEDDSSGAVRGEAVSAEALRCDAKLRARFRRAVGIAFQDPDCQWLCDTVQQEVEFGPMQIWDAGEARERAAQAMVMMGVNHLVDRAPFTLSGGQKRRVALASVIATDPKVLLLDEPTLSLDAATTDFLLDWLEEFLASGEKTLVLTTHDLGLVRELAQRAIVLTPCHKLARVGGVDEILQDADFLQQMNLAGRRGRLIYH